ncbi:hypothetical protein LWI29_015319 [Acer saccharum]|uniref:Sieve element occlusion C-terminal domain-containing protein n=1 Tax=Acer saccharum TaxID=4024 RepID=A0AA39RI17_ACESA|nr:hypothetical protein LWI29_015319 [Acer saccharum]
MTILSFDGSDHCWAGIYRGSEMAKAKGETILNSFIEFPSRKKNANDISFISSLNQHLRKTSPAPSRRGSSVLNVTLKWRTSSYTAAAIKL